MPESRRYTIGLVADHSSRIFRGEVQPITLTDAHRAHIEASLARHPYTVRTHRPTASIAAQPRGGADASFMRASESTWILEYHVKKVPLHGTLCGTLDELLEDFAASWPQWLPPADKLARLPRGGFVCQTFEFLSSRPERSAVAGPPWASHAPHDGAACARFYGGEAVDIRLEEDHADDEEGLAPLPGPEHEAAMAWARREPVRLRDAALGALLRLQRAAHASPVLKDPLDLRWLAHLREIVLLQPARDGMAYLAARFACPWEEEHGDAEIVLHGDRVVAAGYEGTIDRAAAARDAKKKRRR